MTLEPLTLADVLRYEALLAADRERWGDKWQPDPVIYPLVALAHAVLEASEHLESGADACIAMKSWTGSAVRAYEYQEAEPVLLRLAAYGRERRPGEEAE